MTIEEIIKYAKHTPENTNPNVLKSMLSQIPSSTGDVTTDPQFAYHPIVPSGDGGNNYI